MMSGKAGIAATPRWQETERDCHPQITRLQARRWYWKWSAPIDDRQALFIKGAIARTLEQLVRNQLTLAVQHEDNFRGTDRAYRFPRKAFVAHQLN